MEVTHIDAAVRTTGQGHRGEELALQGRAAAARTGNGSVVAISHHCADDWRLLGDEDVPSISFVQDTWLQRSVGDTEVFGM